MTDHLLFTQRTCCCYTKRHKHKHNESSRTWWYRLLLRNEILSAGSEKRESSE